MENATISNFFEKIKILQLLVKEDYTQRVSLTELRNSIISNLTATNKKILLNKLAIFEYLNNSSKCLLDNQPNQVTEHYIINDSPQSFYNSETMYIEAILIFLRKYQQYMYQILINAVSKEQKINLSLFTTEFLYTNILYEYSINEELLICITRCLQYEIKNINRTTNPNDDFLNDSISSYLLNNLIYKNEVKLYFTHILGSVIDCLESKEVKQGLIFIPETLGDNIKKEKAKKSKNKVQKDSGKKIQSENINNENEEKLKKEKEDIQKDKNLVIDKETFYKTYIIDLTLEELNRMFQKYEELEEENNTKDISLTQNLEGKNDSNINKNMNNNKNHEMKDYIWKQISGKKNETTFSNKAFFDNLYKSKLSQEILEVYRRNFCIVVELINLLFKNLIDNIHLVPNSIKYVCKIISYLFKEKNEKIINVELNAFIAEFFFNVLMEPFFTGSDFYGLLSNKITSKNTRNNTILIQKIVKKLVSGFFFNSKEKDESNFTFFNSYFLEIMPKVIDFFQKITEVELPPIIEKILHCNDGNCTRTGAEDKVTPNPDNNSKDMPDFTPTPKSNDNEINTETYYYDYFKENPNENLRYISICYTPSDIINILEIINKNESLFLNQTVFPEMEDEYKYFTASYLKLKTHSHMDNIENAKKLDSEIIEIPQLNEIDMPIKQTRRTFSLYIKTDYSKELKDLMSLNLTPFAIPITKQMLKNENEQTINLINIKNSLAAILYTFHKIPNDNFFGYKINNTNEFINALNKVYKFGYYCLDESTHADWHVLTLKGLLNRIEDDKYKVNDYELIYNELKENIIESINNIKIQPLNLLQERLRYAYKIYENTVTDIMAIDKHNFTKKVRKFINEANVEIHIYTEEDENQQIKLRIAPLLSGVNIRAGKFNSNYTCKNIGNFINTFPIISSLPRRYDEELYVIERNLEAPRAISDYFNLLKIIIKNFFKRSELREMVSPINLPSNQNASQQNIKIQKLEIEKQKEKDKKQKDKKKRGKSSDVNEEESPKEKEMVNLGVDKIFKEVSTFIMNKIYEKIYPNELDLSDILIYQNCCRLSWVEPWHLCKEKNPVLKILIIEAVSEMQKMDSIKNPVGKLNTVNNTLEIILNSLNFISNGKVEGGVDDLLPLLVFVIIQAQPKQLSSNIGFIELFYEDVKIGKDAQRFSMLCAVKEKLLNFTNEDLIDVTMEEFNK